MRTTPLVAVVAAVLTCGARWAVACVCFASPNQPRAAMTFTATVQEQTVVKGMLMPSGALSFTGSGEHREVTLLVTVAGANRRVGEVVKLVTGLGNGDCGVDFETGRKYLVGTQSDGHGGLYSDICLGTREVEAPAPARVCGRVSKPDGSPLAAADVALTEERWPLPAESYGAISDSGGRYCVRGVGPGRYRLTAEYDNYPRSSEALPATSRWAGFSRELLISPGEEARDRDVTVRLQPLYGIWLHVLAAGGEALPSDGLPVWLDSPEHNALAYHMHSTSDGRGWRGYAMVPPGPYTVQVLSPRGDLLLRKQVRINRDTTITLRLKH